MMKAKYRICLLENGKYVVEHKHINSIISWYREKKPHNTLEDAKDWIERDIYYYKERKERKILNKAKVISVKEFNMEDL